MTREKYTILLPGLIVVVIVSAFILSAFFSELTTIFYLAYAGVGGVLILIIDRFARRTLREPVNDERLQGLSERALWVSWRIGSPLIMIIGFILIYGYSSEIELKFIGLGAILSLALLSLVFAVVFQIIRKRN